MTDPTRFAAIADARPDDGPWPAMSWSPDPGTRLRGDVVELTPVDPARDAAELFAALDSDDVWRHVAGRAGDPEDYRRLLARAIDGGRLPWLVRLVRQVGGLAPGTVVGTSSYLEVSVNDARLEIGHTTYTPAVWATAVNPGCKLLLLGHAFDVLHAGRVQLKTDVRNVRSQQAIARLGARYEGTLRRYQRRADGSVRDTVLFSVTAEDWPRVRAGLRTRVGQPR
jgi:RimJ/RimL family protein N-acetyltransferase